MSLSFQQLSKVHSIIYVKIGFELFNHYLNFVNVKRVFDKRVDTMKVVYIFLLIIHAYFLSDFLASNA